MKNYLLYLINKSMKPKKMREKKIPANFSIAGLRACPEQDSNLHSRKATGP